MKKSVSSLHGLRSKKAGRSSQNLRLPSLWASLHLSWHDRQSLGMHEKVFHPSKTIVSYLAKLLSRSLLRAWRQASSVWHWGLFHELLSHCSESPICARRILARPINKVMRSSASIAMRPFKSSGLAISSCINSGDARNIWQRN